MDALPGILLPLTTEPRRSALCLDFDGTLADIVSEPGDARPLPGVPGLLSALAERIGVVAVVSGRPVSFLAEVLEAPAGVRLVGLYGLEWIGRDGTRSVAPGAAPWETVISGVVDRATADAPAGVFVEPKRFTVTMHWRHAPESQPWVERFADEQVDAHHVVAHRSRQSVELGPPLSVDKGTVVHTLAEGMRVVVAFGDDVGDLPAFEALTALAAGGVAVARVAVVDPESPPEVAAQADLLVEGAPGAVALLGQLLEALDLAV